LWRAPAGTPLKSQSVYAFHGSTRPKSNPGHGVAYTGRYGKKRAKAIENYISVLHLNVLCENKSLFCFQSVIKLRAI
jgi:hypothetical protein